MNTTTPATPKATKIAYVIIAAIVVVTVLCLIPIFFVGDIRDKEITADIYQNGILLESINLSEVTEAYRFTITGENNCTNEIEVRPGSIGITAASCPDRLCVHQGFISSSRLPITCLPNRLVIQIRMTEATENITPSLDIISY